MATGFLYDTRYLRHDTGPDFPERPARVERLVAHLKAVGLLEKLVPISPRLADLADLTAVHDPAYVERIQQACAGGAKFVDTPEAPVCAESWEIARLAAGGVLAMVDAVMTGRVANGFCAVRPPGHHAEKAEAMGFCLLGNVAIGAKYLQQTYGLQRVAIVDWDVHHGNGTQHLLENDPSVLFISLHEHPDYLYPGTGHAHEQGSGHGHGYTLNIPMMPGSGDPEYHKAFDKIVLPALEFFAPEVLFISAGFDAHMDDPLAHLRLTHESYRWMTQQLAAATKRSAGGRIISVLEGGYDLRALSECVQTHVETLLEAGQ